MSSTKATPEIKDFVAEYTKTHNPLINYYRRHNKKQRVGVVVAEKDENGLLLVGWSLCNKLDERNRNRYYGLFKAIKRMHPVTPKTVEEVPNSLLDTFNDVLNRATKYYKQDFLHIVNN